MDPNATLKIIDGAKRLNAEAHEAMANLHGWISRGGFPPTWELYPKGTRRFAKVYGKQRGMGATYWTNVR
jgi:hypothetical protein